MKTPPLLVVHAARAVALLALSQSLCAGDWSHILGPGMNRKSAEVAAPWQGGAPQQVWRISAGSGFASFVTGAGRAYTVVTTQANGQTVETAMAVDRETGKTLWQTPLGVADYRNGGDRGAQGNSGGDGPRATPVFADGRVFVFGGNMDLHVLKADTGEPIWKHDLIAEFGGKNIVWSNAASPLVMGDRVLVSGGGKGQSFLAFSVVDGRVLWKGGDDRATHSTPVPATIHGQAHALFLVERGLVALDPASGKELWHYPFPYRTATAASPVVWNNIVNVTAGYGVGGAACQIVKTGDKWEANELWRLPGNRDAAAHWSTAVVHDGFLYGCYGHGEYGSGAFKCIDIRTGKVAWEKKGFGHGQVILAGNRLLATSDAGKLTVIEPTPKEYHELAAAKVIEGKVWASLAFSDGQLFLRSTTQGVCLKL